MFLKSLILVTITALSNKTWPDTGDAFRDSLLWPTHIVNPQNFFNTASLLPGCEMGLMTSVENSLGMPTGAITEHLAQALRMSGDELKSRVENLMIKARASVPASPLSHPLDRSIHTLAQFFRYILEDDAFSPVIRSAVLRQHQPKLTESKGGAHVKLVEGGFHTDDAGHVGSILPDIDLNAVDDLLTGLMSSRLLGKILQSLSPNALMGDVRLLNPMDWSMESALENVGYALCAALDVSTLEDPGSLRKQQALVAMITYSLGCPKKDTKWMAAPDSALEIVHRCEKIKLNENGVYELPLIGKDDIDHTGITPEVIGYEGLTYLGIWTAYSWTTAWGEYFAPMRNTSFEPQPLPGWNVILDFWLKEPGSAYTKDTTIQGIPLTLLATRQDGKCEILLVSRGTGTDYEWGLDFTAQGDPAPEGGAEELLHRGYLQFTNAMLPVLIDHLEGHYFANQSSSSTSDCTVSNTRLIIAGHSLGGGLSYVWANRLSHIYPEMNIDLVVLAPSHSLNDAAMAWVKDHVNVRSILAELDLIPAMPCSNRYGLPRTPGRTAVGIEGEGLDNFAPAVNQIVLSAAQLAALDPARSWFFNDKEFLKVHIALQGEVEVNIPSPIQIMANHVCSYTCWLTANYCTDDPSKFAMCEPKTQLCPNCPNPPPLLPDPARPECPPYAEGDRHGASLKCSNPLTISPCALTSGFVQSITI